MADVITRLLSLSVSLSPNQRVRNRLWKVRSLRSQRATLWPKRWRSSLPTERMLSEWMSWMKERPPSWWRFRCGRTWCHCLLLSRMALQSSDQDCSRLCGGLVATCLLWQAVNRMCSHAGLGSTPDWVIGRKMEHKTQKGSYASDDHAHATVRRDDGGAA